MTTKGKWAVPGVVACALSLAAGSAACADELTIREGLGLDGFAADPAASELYDRGQREADALMTSTAFDAQLPDVSLPRDFCDRTAASIQAAAYDRASRISIYNHGGLLGGGVCWWHSRLQRSALMLAAFRPELPRPTHAQGVAIINTLANMHRVVVIPGYASFYDFSRDYEDEIIRRLEAWQRLDGFLGFRWIDGLMGHWHVAASTLEYIMGRIHQMVSVEHRLVFEKLHLHSIASHAYLVVGSRKTSPGYEIDVIDSNRPGDTLTVEYHRGQTSLYRPDGNEPFVPYLDFDGDFRRQRNALRRYCGAAPLAGL